MKRAFAHQSLPRKPLTQRWKQAPGKSGEAADESFGAPYQEIESERENTMRMEPEVAKGPEGRADEKQRPVERELADLRKEVVEARNLVIKTDNLLKNLFAELKVVSKKNDDQYRRTWFASAAAYGIFLALAVVVAILGAKASVASETAKVEAAQTSEALAKKSAAEANDQFAKLKATQDQAKAASDRAALAYRLMSEGEGESRAKGIDELAKIDRQRLTPLEQRALDERARVLKGELAQAAFEKGRLAFRRGEMKNAAGELRRYLALDPDGADSVIASFYLGGALYQLKDYEGAAPYLEKFTQKTRGKNVDYALFLLGQSNEQLGRTEKAVEAYRRGVNEYPASEFLVQMQVRLRALTRTAAPILPAGQPAPAVPAVAPAAAPVAPKPAVAPAAPAPAPAVH